jgi:hypothetical protein
MTVILGITISLLGVIACGRAGILRTFAITSIVKTFFTEAVCDIFT